ncbi:50S ribosomal protein L19e [Ferroplasma acidiphilum]|jgi:large subunit ribosomal protein L19e|uniref:Large ribosomal subunit protein eL19 n=2 Tax=Ferroplasma TaxID=74968 RepID=S0AQT0_FERAC|nr:MULTISPECIES: 50S ribosomal protein L19e [Ferroplasma]AGO61132.1 50S ribosomal protein L19e [Ferroplasma acidarmanus Fer1]ARD84107.1 50S ribosomal protein L19e [Ferroplasma acidiphilum]MCL4348760.1 50S ribosomal protein L19e [Candidatus Thermoplasmatota archaeon]WMT53007.1 MAG: 50S ribosomal protein L19e [Ferroplasma acidiphilum]
MKMSSVKEISADELKVGISRVWIDTNNLDRVLDATSREDIKKLIGLNIIQRRDKKNHSNQRLKKRINQLTKGRRRGPGSVRGTKYARYPRKRRWITTIRALRDELKTLKEKESIDKTTYRKYYRTIKSGSFSSRAQLVSHLKTESLIKEDKHENDTST